MTEGQKINSRQKFQQVPSIKRATQIFERQDIIEISNKMYKKGLFLALCIASILKTLQFIFTLIICDCPWHSDLTDCHLHDIMAQVITIFITFSSMLARHGILLHYLCYC